MRILKQNIGAHLFYIPALLIFVFYIIMPAILQVYFSIINWEGILPLFNSFTIKNYLEIFKEFTGSSGSRLFNAFKHNIVFMLTVGVVQNGLSFFLAFLFSHKIKDGLLVKRKISAFFRTIYFVPTLVSLAVLGLVFNYILNYYGVLNTIFDFLNLKFLIVDWLGNQNTALLTIGLISSWQYFGLTTLLFYAGFMAVPDDLLEAAEIDGANSFQKLFRIIIPLLAPVITIITTLTFIGSFKVFELPYIMTRNGPGYATDVVMTLIIREGIKNYRFGYGNAASTILFVFISVATIILLRFLKKREENIE